MNARRFQLWLGAGVLLLGSCGHMRFAEHPRARTRWDVQGTPATQYSTQPSSDDALRGVHAFRVGEGIARATQAHPLTPDGRLGELAARIADALDAQGSPPPYAAIDLWTHHLGLFEPAPHLLVLAQSDPTTLPERVQTELATMLTQQRYTHFGAATIERGGNVFAVLVLSWRWAEITPVPRALPAGATIELSGALASSLHTPQFVVSLPDGTSQRADAQKGPKFALSFATHTPGEYRVELLASSDLGETVVANFPLYVGIVPATFVDVVDDTAPAGGAVGETESRAQLLALINEDRKHAGLPALVSNEALARVARAHDDDMQAHGFIGHTSKTTGDAVDRVKRAGIRTPVVLENIGRGYSPDEVHRGLMDSPGHRANVLSSEATDVGIGVLLSSEDQRTAYLVTEVFARFAREIDVSEATSELFEKVNRAREKHGLHALAKDDTMSELCAQAAQHFFKDSRSARQPLVEQLNRDATAKKVRYGKLGALMTVVSSVDEAVAIDTFLDPKARALGLGLAQGTRTDTYDNAIAVVALIGY